MEEGSLTERRRCESHGGEERVEGRGAKDDEYNISRCGRCQVLLFHDPDLDFRFFNSSQRSYSRVLHHTNQMQHGNHVQNRACTFS